MLTRHCFSLIFSIATWTPTNILTTSAFVFVCSLGAIVRNDPSPANANGMSNWSARCTPTENR